MATRSSKADERALAGELLAANLRHARKLSGLSQLQLAFKAELDPQQISKWERGVLKPSDRNLAALAHTLKRDLAWFFTEHETTKEAA